MKRIVALLAVIVTIVSCGRNKSEKPEGGTEAATVLVDKYAVEIEAIYEKDDSIVVFFQKGGHYQYEMPQSLKIKGMPTVQKLTVSLPEGEAVENIKITASTNKEQATLDIKNISVKNGDKLLLDGSNGKHAQYFMTDESFSWDEKTSKYKLDHSKQYSPSLLGNEESLSLLVK